MKTPFEKLASLPGVERFLKPGVTLHQLEVEARAWSDLDSAAELRRAQVRLFERIHSETRRYGPTPGTTRHQKDAAGTPDLGQPAAGPASATTAEGGQTPGQEHQKHAGNDHGSLLWQRPVHAHKGVLDERAPCSTVHCSGSNPFMLTSGLEKTREAGSAP